MILKLKDKFIGFCHWLWQECKDIKTFFCCCSSLWLCIHPYGSDICSMLYLAGNRHLSWRLSVCSFGLNHSRTSFLPALVSRFSSNGGQSTELSSPTHLLYQTEKGQSPTQNSFGCSLQAVLRVLSLKVCFA